MAPRCETTRVPSERPPVSEAQPRPESQRILTPLTEAAIFLVLTVAPGGEEIVRELLADVSGLKRSVGFRIPEGELACVSAIGSELWDRLFGAGRPRPAEPAPVPRLPRQHPHGAGHAGRPAVPHPRPSPRPLLRTGRTLMDRLNGVAQVVDEVHGFRSFDERDLLGFVDGTENPEGAAAVRGRHDRRRGSEVRRRQLRDRAEVRARHRRPGMR